MDLSIVNTFQQWSSSKVNFGMLKDVLLLSLVWIGTALIVDYSGNFPLNDDWSFSLAASRLASEGSYHPTWWTAMPLISQASWGALFCLPMECNFQTFRVSTLTLSLFGIIATYFIVLEINKSRLLALFIAIIVAFSPIYFSLSYTFMTDVPFMAFSTISMLFLMRAVKDLAITNTNFLLGILLAMAAVLCRQSGLFIPVAFGFVIVIRHGFNRASLLKALIPLLIASLSLFIFQYWQEAAGRTPALYGGQIGAMVEKLSNPGLIFATASLNGLVALLYMGLFLLPLLLIMPSVKPVRRGILFYLIVVAVTGTLIILIFPGQRMPFMGNYLASHGVGPLTLRDTYILAMPNVPGLNAQFWTVITLLSCLGAALICAHLSVMIVHWVRNFKAYRHDNGKVMGLFFFSGALIYLFPILLSDFFDRYLIILNLLLSISIIAHWEGLAWPLKRSLIPTSLILVCYVGFSIASTHDYLAWNRARWTALNALHENDVNAMQIDGGFEYNGLYLHDNRPNQDPSKSWWWVHDDRIIVTFGVVPGYRVAGKFAYNRWLPNELGETLGYIYALERQ